MVMSHSQYMAELGTLFSFFFFSNSECDSFPHTFVEVTWPAGNREPLDAT